MTVFEIIGSILLALPISSKSGEAVPYIDALFTATTSTCVTGLVTLTTVSTWSTFGQIVILLLIQIGGLGVITIMAGIMIALNKRIGLSNQLLIQDAFNLNTLSGLALFIKKVIIGIEKNKPAAIDSMKNLSVEGTTVEVKVLPSIYPQGGEKVLIYHTTGKVVGEGKLPMDVGCVVSNCSTVAAIGKYLKTGMPLVERCITVDGGAVKEPKNVIVPIGTSIKDVFEFCGGFLGDPAKVLYGGPMMGIAVATMDAPILKNTNAILALDKKQATPPKTTACIRCGACTNH